MCNAPETCAKTLSLNWKILASFKSTNIVRNLLEAVEANVAVWHKSRPDWTKNEPGLALQWTQGARRPPIAAVYFCRKKCSLSAYRLIINAAFIFIQLGFRRLGMNADYKSIMRMQIRVILTIAALAIWVLNEVSAAQAPTAAVTG